MLEEASVYQRTGIEGAIVSDSTYNMLIGLVLCWGFLVNYIILKYVDTQWLLGMDFRIFLIAYFVSCFFGVFLFNRSTNPFVSFIGYNFVVVPFGLIVNLVVSYYDPALVVQAIQITGLTTVLMMVLGSLYPQFFRSIYSGLTVALLTVVIIELVQVYILHIHQDWIDWVVVLIFCGYIGYDWGRANRIPKTIDNAIDSAAQIYMDIINLFLRILSILGKKKR